MTGFTLSNKAKADSATNRHLYRAILGKRATQLLDETFHLLAGRPLAGKSCDGIKSGYRKFPQGSHVIFYRADTDATVHVIRILHKTMDVELHF